MSGAEVISVCPRDHTEQNCTSSTNTTIHEWKILNSRHRNVSMISRYVSTTTVVKDMFQIYGSDIALRRVSERGTTPLSSALLIDNITVDLTGTRIECTESTSIEPIRSYIIIVNTPGNANNTPYIQHLKEISGAIHGQDIMLLFYIIYTYR